MSQWHRRSRVWRGALGRAMRLHHWRFAVYQVMIGPGIIRYRRVWSRWAGGKWIRSKN